MHGVVAALSVQGCWGVGFTIKESVALQVSNKTDTTKSRLTFPFQPLPFAY